MTLLFNRVVKAAARGHIRFDEVLTEVGMTAKDALGLMCRAEVYRVDDADPDTTICRERHPAYFSTTAGLVLPARLCWIEYKVYHPIAGETDLRGAYLAGAQPDGGIRVFVVSEVGDGTVVFSHAFDLPASIVGQAEVLEGRAYVLRTNHQDPRIGTVADFFMELVAFLNLPSGLTIETVQPPAATVRNVRETLGAKAPVPNCRNVSFDLESVRFQ